VSFWQLLSFAEQLVAAEITDKLEACLDKLASFSLMTICRFQTRLKMMDTALIAFVIVELIPVSWYMEMKADEAAARFVGKSYIQSALLKLSNPEEAKINSESHPSVEERIKHIEKLKL
jgi:hypothetical protein